MLPYFCRILGVVALGDLGGRPYLANFWGSGVDPVRLRFWGFGLQAHWHKIFTLEPWGPPPSNHAPKP